MRVPSSATFRVPYWPVFAATAALAPLGIVLVAFLIDDLTHLMSGASFAVVLAQLILLVTVCGVVAVRFEYLTLYRLELDAEEVNGRSTLKTWTFSLSEVEAIEPGWIRPWWVADHNRYVVKLSDGMRLYIWSGKGLSEFLELIAMAEPRLRIGDGLPNRAERSRGRSGFNERLRSDSQPGAVSVGAPAAATKAGPRSSTTQY